MRGVGRVADLVPQRAEVGWVRWAAPLQYQLAVDGLDVGQVERRTRLRCRGERRHLDKLGGKGCSPSMKWKRRVFIQDVAVITDDADVVGRLTVTQ